MNVQEITKRLIARNDALTIVSDAIYVVGNKLESQILDSVFQYLKFNAPSGKDMTAAFFDNHIDSEDNEVSKASVYVDLFTGETK